MKIKIETDNGRTIYSSELISDEVLKGVNGEVFKELNKLMKPFEDAIKVFIDRHEDYGNTWELTEFENHEAMLNSLVCFVKAKRICAILDKQDKHKIPVHKLMNNSLDLINYANFLYQSICKYVKEMP
jgi:hypothetical protein